MKSVCILIVTAPLLFGAFIQDNSCNSKRASQSKAANSPTPTASVDMKKDPATPRPTSATAPNRLPPGTWGGLHVNLEISDNESSLEFDCANGKISEPILLDSDGRFEVRGTYTREGPGPTREGAQNRSNAVYSGAVKGGTMTLSIRLNGSSDSVLDLSLEHGKQGRLRKCY